MDIIRVMFEVGMDIMRFEFTIFGYSLSFWNIFVYSAVVSVLAWAIWRFILND